MKVFFETPFLFWYVFVFSFLICTGVGALIQCWFLIKFCGAKSRKRFYFVYLLISYGLFLTSMAISINISPILDTLLGVDVAFVFTSKLLKQDYTMSAIAAALMMAVGTLAESLIFLLELSGIRILGRAEITPIIGQLLFLIIVFLMFKFFISRYTMKSHHQSKYLLVFSLPIFFISVVLRIFNHIRYTIDTEGVFLQSDRIDNYEVFIITIGAFLCICTILFAYEKTVKQMENDNREMLLHAQIAAQKSYVAEAKQKYQTTKAFRHDLKNHIIALTGLIRLGDIEKAEAYMERFREANNSITFPITTGNSVIDALLGEKLSYAKQLGIDVKCDIEIPETVKIDDFDLCTIFANAIDNAIKNCNEVSEDKKEIDIAAKPNKNFFVIDMVNNYQEENIIKGSGIGLTAIEIVVQKHQGAIEIFDKNNLFRISVILPFDE